MDLVTVFPEQFEEIVDVVCKGKMPKKIDSTFWLELQEMKLSSEQSHCMAKLLIETLREVEDISFSDIFINEIVKEIGELTHAEKKLLNEVLLKNNLNMVV